MKRIELLEKLDLSCFVAFDFETTGLDPYGDKIIEIAAIRFKDGVIADRFVHLLNPERNIPPLITEITGISDSMVRAAPTEEMIIDDLLDFIGDDPLVAHNIHFDEQFLSQLCKRLGRKEVNNLKYDTLQLSRSLLFEQPVFNLGALSEYYGLSSEGAHRAENDTENTGHIFLELIDEASKYPIDVISKVNAMLEGSEVPNQQLYIKLGNELTRKGDMKTGINQFNDRAVAKSNTLRCEGNHNIEDICAEDVFGANGMLAEAHPNFENRPSQEKYAKVIDEIINTDNNIGVIEAGTGLGKSMAYLFGAFRKSPNLDNEGPTIIACHTKHLQDQLFHKDLPLLAKALDVPLKAVLLKGRKNYLCKTRFNWILSDSKTLDGIDLEALIPILFWMYWTRTGDLSECSGFFNARRTWLKSMICSDSGFCNGDICNRYNGCYYGKLKRAIFQAHVIVINHSLLMTNIVQPGLIPEFNSVIIDEAHNLVKSAYDQFKLEWSEQQVSYLLQTVDPSFPRSARWNNIIQSINDLNPEVGAQRDLLIKAVSDSKLFLKDMMDGLSNDNQDKFSPHNSYQDQPILGNIQKAYAGVQNDLVNMKNGLEKILSILTILKKLVLEMDTSRTDYPILHTAMDRGIETMTGLMTSLVTLTEEQDPEWVYWMQGEYRFPTKGKEKLVISLYASMIDVSDTLNRAFFECIDNCVLTSATLKVNDSFNYFLLRVGLDSVGHVTTKEFLSPFLYNEQVRYYQYAGKRELSNDPEGIGDVVYNLHKLHNKRIMVLFTSIRTLTDTAKYLKSKPNGRDLPLFAQVRGASRPSIIKGMHQQPNGILFGTNSFWEGVDLPGDLLEILILVKLPFDVPSEPLVRSYSDHINKMGGNSFMDYSLPETAIRFRQGFGRLIRTSYDAGKFICLDNRIVLKRYGSILSGSVPVEMVPFSDIDSIE